jgi:DNA-binding response OmpR family regulator
MKPTSILVTDDERNIRMMLRTALESDGYTVMEASNGREAMDIILSSTPDLVVLDLNMPVMDGMSVLEQLKGMSGVRKPRVIILTAYGSIATAVKATRLGALDFLEKPVAPADLRNTIRSVLTEPELDSPPPSVEAPGGYASALSRIRRSLEMVDLTTAESLLMKAAERQQVQSAEYFNLLGVLYEAQRKWRLAQKCYGRAIAADKRYEPAQINMRRIYELNTFGRSDLPAMLGNDAPADEPVAASQPSGSRN